MLPNSGQTAPWFRAVPVFEESTSHQRMLAANSCDCGECYCSGLTPEMEAVSLAIVVAQHLAASALAKAFGYGKDDDD